MIRNITKKTVFSTEYTNTTGLSKIRGLMYKNNCKTILFHTHFGVHTFGLKFPIDLVILNNKKQVAFLKESLPPNRFIFWNPKYNLVIEAPINSIVSSKTKKGDLFKL